MRLAIYCIDRIGVVREVLDFVAQMNLNLQRIELKKVVEKGIIYLQIEEIAQFQFDYLKEKIHKIPSVSHIEIIPYLPCERHNIEYKSILESLPNPVLSLDPQGKIEFLNQQAIQLFSLLFQVQPKASFLIGKAFETLLPIIKKTNWYTQFIQQTAQLYSPHLLPISQHIEIDEQIWRIDILPLQIDENELKKCVGSVVVLQSHHDLRIDLQQFSAFQDHAFDNVIAHSPNMQLLVQQAKKFAFSNAPLLIQGETGVGKELIAKACHNLSYRKDKKFIAINCAGLPSDDAESEMFGRKDNEHDTLGFFEYAHGGTVLLDGISELPLSLQAKLLRFLNDGSFRRVGEEKEKHADVRVICTAQNELHQAVEEGKVREDLYYRLNVLTLTVPPLRDRYEDIPDLTYLFVQQICQQLGIPLLYYDQKFIHFLEDYPWVGNVRELYNALYRACSLAENGQLSIHHLGLLDKACLPQPIDPFNQQNLEQMMANFEATVLRQFYEQYPSTRKLGQRLGMSHTAIANKLRQYGIGGK